MNTLSVRARIEQDPEDNKPYLRFKITIDGEPLVDLERYGLAIDYIELASTINEDGEFYIVTCTCRVAMCAGIKEGIRVFRDNKNIHWIIRWYWGPTRALAFEREAYAHAIEQGIREYKKLRTQHPDVDVSPFGMS